MKVLVTGAGGFLGVQVVSRLLAHGYTDIRCFLRDRGKAEKLLALAKSYPCARLELCFGNLRSKPACAQAVEDVSLVVHLVAGMKGAAAEMFADSVVVARNLLEALEARSGIAMANTRVVLVSSFGVYGVTQLKEGRVSTKCRLSRITLNCETLIPIPSCGRSNCSGNTSKKPALNSSFCAPA